mmetsp:Transcript_6043/g.6910  ORF Transcript_6043/g.6910 Transcript_6043/m.6910 type:complete len:440 (-) Transcript_6043:121-1440(-)
MYGITFQPQCIISRFHIFTHFFLTFTARNFAFLLDFIPIAIFFLASFLRIGPQASVASVFEIEFRVVSAIIFIIVGFHQPIVVDAKVVSGFFTKIISGKFPISVDCNDVKPISITATHTVFVCILDVHRVTFSRIQVNSFRLVFFVPAVLVVFGKPIRTRFNSKRIILRKIIEIKFDLKFRVHGNNGWWVASAAVVVVVIIITTTTTNTNFFGDFASKFPPFRYHLSVQFHFVRSLSFLATHAVTVPVINRNNVTFTVAHVDIFGRLIFFITIAFPSNNFLRSFVDNIPRNIFRKKIKFKFDLNLIRTITTWAWYGWRCWFGNGRLWIIGVIVIVVVAQTGTLHVPFVADNVLNPIDRIARSRIHTGTVGLGTTFSPTHDTDLVMGAAHDLYERTAAVALTRIFLSLRESRAQHCVGDLTVVVWLAVAHLVRHGRNLNF